MFYVINSNFINRKHPENSKSKFKPHVLQVFKVKWYHPSCYNYSCSCGIGMLWCCNYFLCNYFQQITLFASVKKQDTYIICLCSIYSTNLSGAEWSRVCDSRSQCLSSIMVQSSLAKVYPSVKHPEGWKFKKRGWVCSV